MGSLVIPKVYLVGQTTLDKSEVLRYLRDSGNEDFAASMADAELAGLSGGEIMCSLFAKLCYKSLSLGHNPNVTRVRDIADNIRNCFSVGHGSIFEHLTFNFIITDCSRVMTHELVRHRVGTAFSQNSGRYIRITDIDMVYDPILDPAKDEIEQFIRDIEEKYRLLCERLKIDEAGDFTTKKKLTSALRRIAPNGQSNEIALSINLRALRHTILLRTSRHAEWEIRHVFAEIYKIMKERYPLMFADAIETVVDGILEITGMKMQPYEDNGNGLNNVSTDTLLVELSKRTQGS